MAMVFEDFWCMMLLLIPQLCEEPYSTQIRPPEPNGIILNSANTQ